MTISTISADLSPNESQSQYSLTRGVRRVVLENGLTVITKESHYKPIVATMIWYRVGSRNEELGQTGKSHFLEHMLFKGTDRYEKGEIDFITLKNGGANNAFTWLDYTAYYFTFASDRWETALEIEANRMRNTSFDEAEFESEKRVVQEELRIGLDGPWEALENEVWATAFRQHSYHWPTVGWLEDLEVATAADMKGYYDKWYHPGNAILVVVGDFNTEKALGRIRQLFGPIPPGPMPRPSYLVEPEQKGEKRVTVKKATPLERLLIGYHAPQIAHPDSYPLQVVETLLSAGKMSRLYQRLIERDQLVGNVKATYSDHIDPSLFYIQAELKIGVALSEVERAVDDEIRRLGTEPIPDHEIEMARHKIEADLVLANESPLQQAVLLGQFETIAAASQIEEESRGYRFLETLLGRIYAVSAEDVMRVVRKYLNPDNRTVGYLINKEPAAEGPVQPGDSGSRNRIAHYRTTDSPYQAADFKRYEQKPPEITAHSFGTAASRPKIDVERVVLDNGLVLLLSANHASPAVSIDAVVQTGSRFEPDEKAGLASLIGEMLDEGTTTRTSEQIAQLVESVGGRLNTYGHYQWSGAQASFLSKDIPLAIEIVGDIVTSAIFPEEKVKQYIARQLVQIRSRLDVPRVQASDVFNEIVFKEHPQHRPPIGYEDTVKRLTRDDLLDFHRRYYAPNNTILSVVGDIDKSEVRAKVEQVLAGWKPAQIKVTDRPEIQFTGPTERFVTVSKEQVNIFIGHLGIARKNPDYYALLVLDTILGSSPGFTSRIPRILRDEQGLAYTTFSNITGTAGIDPGRFVAYIGTSPQSLDRALTGLRQEIQRIVEEPVTENELESAKSYLTGNFVFDFQTNSQIAQFLVEAEVYDLGYDYLEIYPERIRSVTIADVGRVARQYIHPNRLTTVVVGPVGERGIPVS